MNLNLTLKDFQEEAVSELYRHARAARRDVGEGDLQALILAAPTGSGKTVIANALFQRIVRGDEEYAGDAAATFLWLSDQPALNEQTKRKFEANSSPSVFGKNQLITIESEFDEPRFAPGHVYFLNTQKIGKDKKLVSPGDRTSTIWETIARTAQESPESFWVCIDEAHRGMSADDDHKVAQSIAQKFIVGSPGEIPAVPLILGVSATPERFASLLTGKPRTQRSWPISPDDVRSSGLIKDWITLYHPKEKQPSDYTLLQAAAAKLKEFGESWNAYSSAQKTAPVVEPLLVVQVEDAQASSKSITKTDVVEAIRAIEAGLGRPLEENEIGHALQEGSALEFGDRMVEYVKPPDIQERSDLRVVFFKMSLNTGWDCPRAEVMMSFRRAVDYTHIAQLVGRMVRNPLARRITTDETLNSVALYLPYYDEDALGQVVSYLESPDAEVGLASRVRKGEFTITVERDTKLQKVIEFAGTLPSYDVERVPKVSSVKRLVRLARFLSQDKIDEKAYDRERAWVVAQLEKERKRVQGTAAFKSVLADATKITVREQQVAYAAGSSSSKAASAASASAGNGATTSALSVAEQNIDDMYDASGRQLGEGLHADYVRARVTGAGAASLREAKLELYALLVDPKTLEKLDEACSKRFTALHAKWRDEIAGQPEGRRQAYRRLLKIAKKPEAGTLALAEKMLGDKRETRREKHLFVDKTDGKYPCKLNGWEQDVLAKALAEKGAVAWLRNVPRQDGSFVVPYRHHGEDRPMYPDFLVFRKKGAGFVVDVLEPHASAFEDGWAKAVGLAEFAQQHGDQNFGRIELLTKIGKEMKRLDVNKPEIRQKVLGVLSNQHLKQLFEDT